VSEPHLLTEAEKFLRQVVGYQQSRNVRLEPGDTLAYGYWLTRFEPLGDQCLEVWEADPAGHKFVLGASLTLTYYREQRQTCARARADFAPPFMDKLAAVSVGVLEGDPVEGVRYPSPEHMSGWWLTTDRYGGSIDAMRVEHLYHVTAARPDLARYLALPYGFRFRSGDGEYIYFDEEVAKSPPSSG
jgi:hypothetical protein